MMGALSFWRAARLTTILRIPRLTSFMCSNPSSMSEQQIASSKSVKQDSVLRQSLSDRSLWNSGRCSREMATLQSACLVGKENVAVVTGKTRKRKMVEAELEPEIPLRVKKLSKNASLPKRGSAGAAGYDLASAEDCVVPGRGQVMVKTDLSLAIPPGTYGRVAPRSGLALKHSIDTGAGVIDEDYRGPLGVILFNFSDKDFQIKKGDRIAQLVLERIYTPEVVEVDDLEETKRGAGGFGSTGVSKSPKKAKEETLTVL